MTIVSKFSQNDVVLISKSTKSNLVGKIGVVQQLNDLGGIGVDVGFNFPGGHTLDGYIKTLSGWYFNGSELTKVFPVKDLCDNIFKGDMEF